VKQNINNILKEVLLKVNPPKEDIISIDKFLNNFIPELEKKLKAIKITAQVFVGGSYAKRTMIKKGQYDIDVFIRFDEKYRGKDISKLAEKAIKKTKRKFSVIHGSRNYFHMDVEDNFYIEIIPVIKVKNPKEAENITDLSYFHVGYMKKKLKTEKILEEIRITKAFCHANHCYGAESYIHGFSGYALELLISNYKTFLNFAKNIVKIKEKEIIDSEKLYKNRTEVMMNMNGAKTSSPIIVIDPTYKERNALAALSKETFKKTKEACEKFLKNPTRESFEVRKPDLELIEKNASKKGLGFVLVNLQTNKQEGDIAGSKLVKFYNHLTEEINKFYKITNKGFEYNGKKEAQFFFVAKNKGDFVVAGPDKKDQKNVDAFELHHERTFVKGNKVYARESNEDSISEFIAEWKIKNNEKIEEMSITDLKIIDQI
jgi:tRNA nucleotidyltransferase (CCA-adding enzyme)